MDNIIPVRNVLISVFDKNGLDSLVAGLAKYQVHFYSTGGTAKFLKEKCNVSVTPIDSLTDFPELMEGRVKTLHPCVFGGILARRDNPKDLEEAKAHGIPLLDLVVCNLYPFAEHLSDDVKTQSGFVDIGGPSMIRAAAKNHCWTTAVSHPEDYPALLEELEKHGGATTLEFRRQLAARTFARTSAYDALISQQWSPGTGLPTAVSLNPQQPLRYGENPHQKAAWSQNQVAWKLLQGKELSYNNILDAEAAVRITSEFRSPCAAIVKHNNPCGVASGNKPIAELWSDAFKADSQSAFGGIVATNQPVDGSSARAMSEVFLEVVIAPSFSAEALATFSSKKNLRLIEWKSPQFQRYEVRAALGGWLIQESNSKGMPDHVQTVTLAPLPSECSADVEFAWLVCKHVRSNAIVVAKNGVTLGIGAGQMSRVDAVRIALEKCPKGSTAGAVLASDAFFPFRDNIDLLKGSGIRAIIQPGGSKRDAEVIEACNQLGIAMVFTGTRHFRH